MKKIDPRGQVPGHDCWDVCSVLAAGTRHQLCLALSASLGQGEAQVGHEHGHPPVARQLGRQSHCLRLPEPRLPLHFPQNHLQVCSLPDRRPQEWGWAGRGAACSPGGPVTEAALASSRRRHKFSNKGTGRGWRILTGRTATPHRPAGGLFGALPQRYHVPS